MGCGTGAIKRGWLSSEQLHCAGRKLILHQNRRINQSVSGSKATWLHMHPRYLGKPIIRPYLCLRWIKNLSKQYTESPTGCLLFYVCPLDGKSVFYCCATKPHQVEVDFGPVKSSRAKTYNMQPIKCQHILQGWKTNISSLGEELSTWPAICGPKPRDDNGE